MPSRVVFGMAIAASFACSTPALLPPTVRGTMVAQVRCTGNWLADNGLLAPVSVGSYPSEPPIWTQHRTLYRCLRLQGKRAALADTNSKIAGWGRVRSPSTAAARCGTPRGARSGAASAERKRRRGGSGGQRVPFASLYLTIIFSLNSVRMYSIVNDYFPVTSIPSILYVGCTHGACCCHLQTTRSKPYGAL